MPVVNRIADFSDEMKGWRRHLHAHPELAFDCHETAAFVVERLKEFGVDEIHESIATSGVVAIINGQGDGPTMGLRADMDALPMDEITGLDHASTVDGKMHAWGHDGHTTMLLGAAKYLSETRKCSGRVALFFQPAEEDGGGGREMGRDGMMDRWNIQEVYGMHNGPGSPVGEFAIRPGALMASADEFEIVVTGKGGHAAEPAAAVDTTLVAAQILVSLQSIVSRNVKPIERVVLTVGTLETDSNASNVIAHTVRMKGTVRTLDNNNRELAERRIREVATHTALAFGATAEVSWEEGYPVTVNHDRETEFAVEAAPAVAG